MPMSLHIDSSSRKCPLCEVELQPQDFDSHLDWHTSRMRDGSQDLTRQEILFIGETFAEFRSPGQNATSQIEEAAPLESPRYKQMKARKALKAQTEQNRKNKGKLDAKPADSSYDVDEEMKKFGTESGNISVKISSKKKPKKKNGKRRGKEVSGVELLSDEYGLENSCITEQNRDAAISPLAAAESGLAAKIYDIEQKTPAEHNGKGRLDEISEISTGLAKIYDIEQKTPAEHNGKGQFDEISEISTGLAKMYDIEQKTPAEHNGKESESEKNQTEALESKSAFDIFMEPLKKEYGRYLAALSSSSDASVSVRQECESLANRSSSFFAGPAREEFIALNMKIVNEGIDYAFIDAPVRLSFLTCAVAKFASKLPTNCIHDILKNFQERTLITDSDVDPICWLPYWEFIDTLEKVANGEDPGSDIVTVVDWDDFGGEAISSDFEDDVCEFYSRGEYCEEEIKGKRFSPYQTGRKGEAEAYRLFHSRFSNNKTISWVNELRESGLPYDIRLEAKDKTSEYVEVKSTSVENKNWFYLTVNEYLFALKNGAAYIIARVILSDGELIKIITYRNPGKLFKSNKLRMKFVVETC